MDSPEFFFWEVSFLDIWGPHGLNVASDCRILPSCDPFPDILGFRRLYNQLHGLLNRNNSVFWIMAILRFPVRSHQYQSYFQQKLVSLSLIDRLQPQQPSQNLSDVHLRFIEVFKKIKKLFSCRKLLHLDLSHHPIVTCLSCADYAQIKVNLSKMIYFIYFIISMSTIIGQPQKILCCFFICFIFIRFLYICFWILQKKIGKFLIILRIVSFFLRFFWISVHLLTRLFCRRKTDPGSYIDF